MLGRTALVAIVAGALGLLLWGMISSSVSSSDSHVSGAETKAVSRAVAPEAVAFADGALLWVAGIIVTAGLAVVKLLR